MATLSKDPTFLLLDNMCVEYNTTTVVYALFCGNMPAFSGELRRWRGEERRAGGAWGRDERAAATLRESAMLRRCKICSWAKVHTEVLYFLRSSLCMRAALIMLSLTGN